MQILTIFTGGTIGSRVENGVIADSKDTNYLLLDIYKKACGDDVSFLTKEPYRILSENLQAEHLISLGLCVQESLSECKKAKEEGTDGQFAGIIITHGTDTLQYSAAYLQYLFADAPIPIILVSSDFVLTDPRANGLHNFIAAVEFIKNGYGKGVFVSYENGAGKVFIHRGTRLQHVISYSPLVYSIMGSYYGVFEAMKEGGYRYAMNPAYQEEQQPETLPIAAENLNLSDTADSIVRLSAYPGMKYPLLDETVKAVLYDSYHSGTICIDDKLKAFAADAVARDIPIYLIGLGEGEAEYETVEMYRAIGVQTLTNRATVAQFMKLWIAIENDLDIKAIMNGVFAGEKVL